MREYSKEVVSFEGDKVKVDDILDEVIVINNFAVKPSKFSKGDEYVIVSAELNGKAIIFNTGSGVIRSQLEQEEKEGFPVRVKIVRIERKDQPNYLSFAPPTD